MFERYSQNKNIIPVLVRSLLILSKRLYAWNPARFSQQKVWITRIWSDSSKIWCSHVGKCTQRQLRKFVASCKIRISKPRHAYQGDSETLIRETVTNRPSHNYRIAKSHARRSREKIPRWNSHAPVWTNPNMRGLKAHGCLNYSTRCVYILEGPEVRFIAYKVLLTHAPVLSLIWTSPVKFVRGVSESICENFYILITTNIASVA